MEWDYEGEILAIVQANYDAITLFYLTTKKVDTIETTLSLISHISWSKNGPLLAVGNEKGTLLIYNTKTTKIIPVKGTHSGKIIGGDWSQNGDFIALCGQDNQITISNKNGDTLFKLPLRGPPSKLAFCTSPNKNDLFLSAIIGGKYFWLFNVPSENKKSSSTSIKEGVPYELGFEASYGDIVNYSWFGEGHIAILFEKGRLVVISTHSNELGDEIASRQVIDSAIDIHCVTNFQKNESRVAIVGKKSVAVLELTQLSKVSKTEIDIQEIEAEYGSLQRVEWSQDGQIVTVSTNNGSIYSYITSIPKICSVYRECILYLVSLRECSIKEMGTDELICNFDLEVEPSILSLGDEYAAVGMNNRIWFYKINKSEKKCTLLFEKEYLTTINQVLICDVYVAVFTGGRIVVHPIEKQTKVDGMGNPIPAQQQKEEKILPEYSGVQSTVTSMAATDHFLIFSTDAGEISYFSLVDWKIINYFRSQLAITSVFSNALGTKLAFLDETHDGYVLNPLDNSIAQIPNLPGSVDKVFWDLDQANSFVVSDGSNFSTYAINLNTLKGTEIRSICERTGDSVKTSSPLKTDRPFGWTPVAFIQGKIVCQNAGGKIVYVPLNTHNALRINSQDPLGLEAQFGEEMALLRIEDAWETLNRIPNAPLKHFQKIAEEALHQMNIEIAYLAYQKLENSQMVFCLDALRGIGEKNLLLAYISLLTKDFDEAEKKFLQSSEKIKAYEMRRDLLSWERALQLAETLDRSQLPFISREYAQQLELKEEYKKAYTHYTKALQVIPGNNQEIIPFDTTHIAICDEGKIRCMFRLGEIDQGMKEALRSKNKKLCRDCAGILEEMKQFNDAAALYVKGEMFEKAAEIFLQEKNFKKVNEIIENVKAPKLLLQIAKTNEANGQLEPAVDIYTKANDLVSVVRLYLTKLNNPAKAIEVVKQSKSADAAILVARYCQKKEDYKLAIEFLFIGKSRKQAFQIAKVHNEMETYIEQIEKKPDLNEPPVSNSVNPPISATVVPFITQGEITVEEYAQIAAFYESKKQYAKAGDYYTKAEEYENALKQYILAGEDTISRAIDVVGLAKNDSLTQVLIDYLTGANDGVSKSPKNIFKLYIALGEFKQAANTANVISTEEQKIGNYTIGHEVLFETISELQKNKMAIPFEISNNLMLIHSYLIIKNLVILKEQPKTARLLVRVAKNISKFPKHIVPILTSTVIECYKAGLKSTAFQYATILVRPEHRNTISEKFKKSIMQIVRKRKISDKDKEPSEHLSECPKCGSMIPDSELYCPTCKNHIPYCSVTGTHMVADDWSECPHCKFPASFSYFKKFIGSLQNDNEKLCPMCKKKVDVSQIMKIQPPKSS